MTDPEHSDSENVEQTIVALNDRIQRLEAEKKAFEKRIRMIESKSLNLTHYLLILFGGVALVWAIYKESTVLAFIGLGLTFWGVLFEFVKKIKYVKPIIMNSAIVPNLRTIGNIILDLELEGRAVYLPPSPYKVKGFKGGYVYIASEKDLHNPIIGDLPEGKTILENPKGLLLTPPGLDLVNLFEKELEKELIQVDFEYLSVHLPKLLVEKLEIANGFKIIKKDNKVNVKIVGSIFEDICKQLRDSGICNSIGCPLCSSIACALTRTLGKPVIIEKADLIDDDNAIQVIYTILEV